MNIRFTSLFKIVLEGKSSIRFLIAAIASFGFSISVILSTVGLMDGFEFSLVNSLRKSSSDLIITSRQENFNATKLTDSFDEFGFIQSSSSLLLKESFAVYDESSKGALVHGIDNETFKTVTDLDIVDLEEEEIIIGKELANFYKASEGDDITLLFASNKTSDDGIPRLMSFKLKKIITHGLYEKDLRFVYINKSVLAKALGFNEKASSRILLKTRPNDLISLEKQKNILAKNMKKLNSRLKINPFWKEFDSLIEAVEVEKFSITMILQLIVLVSIFNILAFVIFVVERQSQSFFLLTALGMSRRVILRFWFKLLIFIWLSSCLVSIVLTYIFDFLLGHLTVFQLPGDVYVLSNLTLKLTSSDFLMVFGIAALWIFILAVICSFKLKSKTTLAGLRQEFS